MFCEVEIVFIQASAAMLRLLMLVNIEPRTIISDSLEWGATLIWR